MPFIGLDDCHLKSKYMGSLLTATTLNGNNGLFLITFAVVKSENLLSWHWFITNLKDTFAGELENIIVISDQQKAFKDAIEHLLLHENTEVV